MRQIKIKRYLRFVDYEKRDGLIFLNFKCDCGGSRSLELEGFFLRYCVGGEIMKGCSSMDGEMECKARLHVCPLCHRRLS